MSEYKFIKLTKRAKDLNGQTFTRLTVVGPINKTKQCKIQWLCICECGSETIVSSDRLVGEISRSCGCLKLQIQTTHMMTGTPEYRSWDSMLQRTGNPNSKAFKNYGARKISCCKRWKKFEQFFSDMGPKPSMKHSIDRIDNNGDYCPENCRWATPKEQQRNKNNNRKLTFMGKTKCAVEWSEITGIRHSTIFSRLLRGWSVKRTLTEPVNSYLK